MSNTELSEAELDWRENQSRTPAEAARTDLLMIAVFGLATVACVAILILLYRYLS